MKKIVAFLLAVVMAAGLVACGGNASTEKGKDSKSNEETYVYLPEYIKIPSGENMNYNVVSITNNEVYFTYYIWDEETSESKQGISKINIEDENAQVEDIPVTIEANCNMMKTVIDSEGNIYIAFIEYAPTQGDEMGGSFDYSNPTYSIKKYLADGTLDCTHDITQQLSDGNGYIQNLEIDLDGNVFFSNGNNIYVLDSTGKALFSVSADWINALARTNSGEVYAFVWGNNGLEARKVDLASKALGTTISNIPRNFNNSNISRGQGNDLIFISESSIYDYNIDTQTSEKLLDLMDCDINSNYVQAVSMLPDGRVVVYYMDWEDGTSEIVLLTRTLVTPEQKKETIVFATMYLDSSVQRAIIAFNKASDKYRITIKNYSESMGEEENAYQDAINRMTNDILLGNTIDLIELSSVNLEQFAAKGAIEDLAPYLQNSEKISRDELVESVLTAYTINDVLCTIPTSFSINTLMSSVAIVGDRMGWTLADLMETYARMPEGTQIYEYATKSSVLSNCIYYSANDFINWSTGECKFDGEDFIRVLEFANQFDMEYNWDEDAPSMPQLVKEGKLMLVDKYLYSISEYQVTNAIFKEPTTFIGYPCSTSNGSYINGTNSMMGIYSKSKVKDGAWAFIESMLVASAEGSDRYSFGFPTVKTKLEETFAEAMVAEYEMDANGDFLLDENGEKIERNKGGYGWGNDDEIYYVYAATQEDVDTVRELINNTTSLSRYDAQLYNIIYEEAQPFFEGQKTAKDVATIIQSRAKIYVDESR